MMTITSCRLFSYSVISLSPASYRLARTLLSATIGKRHQPATSESGRGGSGSIKRLRARGSRRVHDCDPGPNERSDGDGYQKKRLSNLRARDTSASIAEIAP